MPADDAPRQALVAEVVDAAIAAVALAGRVDERELRRRAVREEVPFDGGGDRLGVAGADEPGARDGRAVADQPDRVIDADSLQ